MVIDKLPTWSSNRATRLVRSPKYHLVEPALMAPLLGVDERSILRDADLLGRLIETYVLSQLRVEATVADKAVNLFHLRDKDGTHEVDIIAERADGSIVAIEVKATSAPTIADAKHLLWLKERVGNKFAKASFSTLDQYPSTTQAAPASCPSPPSGANLRTNQPSQSRNSLDVLAGMAFDDRGTRGADVASWPG